MSRLDLVIFGATGFTGKHVVEELARGGKHFDGLTWGIAGRSKSKLETLLADLSKATGKNLSHVRMIVADVCEEQALKEMCAQTKVLVNCAGPYGRQGEPVVKAAIESTTHYVDVAGETLFMETMQLRYNEQAKKAGVFVISACGFDSIPNDLGIIFMQQALDGTLNSVESYLTTYVTPEYKKEATKTGIINYGTWDSLVNSIASKNELIPLRKQMYPEKLPEFKPTLKSRPVLHKHEDVWCVPFLGADAAIVYRTHRTIYEATGERPVQFKTYVKLSGLITTLCMTLGAVVMFAMAQFKWTRSLLLNHPKFFTGGAVTREGPSDAVMKNTHFQFDLYGEGWAKGEDVNAGPPNKKIVAKVSGSNPGYGATAAALLCSALSVLREADNMPTSRGVMTPGVAFRNTNIIKHLHENNLKFEIIENK